MSVGVADKLVLEADVDVQCYPLCDAENSMEPFVVILMAFMLNRNAWSLKQIRSHNVSGCVNPFCTELSQVRQGPTVQKHSSTPTLLSTWPERMHGVN